MSAAALLVDSAGAGASVRALNRSEVLVVTSWYPTPESPFSYPFIRDHLSAWVDHLFEDDGALLAVIHPQEALSLLAAIKHGQGRFIGRTEGSGWRVIHAQGWRLKRRWSQGDLVREIRSLKRALSRFRWLEGREPRLIIAQTLSAARQSLLLRRSMKWASPVVLIEHSSPLAIQFQVEAAEPYQRKALCDVDAVIAVSRNLAESIIEVRGPRNVHVIPNPVDPNVFTTPLPEPWTSGPLRLVNVGFCTEQKAQDVLIRAVELLSCRGIDASLEIVGDGPDRPRLERLASEMGLAGRVSFRGALPRAEVLSALARSHIFVFPSRWENCPVALEEAQAVGLPVVVTANDASEKILVHQDSRVCPVDDPNALAEAVESLASSPHIQSAARRRESARLAFAPEYFAAKCKQIFSGVIGDWRE